MEAPPSQNKDKCWIEVHDQTRDIVSYPDRGKWLIFSSLYDLDDRWDSIKEGTKSGVLGPFSCVRTVKEDCDPIDGHVYEKKVICVFTYSEYDEKDISRVRQELWRMGFHETLYYKTRRATQAGEYSHLGHKNISKYAS